MDKRTSARLAKLAGRVVKDGVCTPAEAKRLAGCVLAQAHKGLLAKPAQPSSHKMVLKVDASQAMKSMKNLSAAAKSALRDVERAKAAARKA